MQYLWRACSSDTYHVFYKFGYSSSIYIILEANNLAPTKRSVLELTGMFFDPLGLTLSIIIQSYLMFQRVYIA